MARAGKGNLEDRSFGRGARRREVDGNEGVVLGVETV